MCTKTLQKCKQQLTAARQPDIGPIFPTMDKAAPLRKTVSLNLTQR